MLEKTFCASTDEIRNVMNFVSMELEKIHCSAKIDMQIGVALEEIFTNIAQYAYPDGGGEATICIECGDGTITIVFKDSGIPFDPFAKEDPDTTLSAEERRIGGLGIFMVKKMMDDMKYEYADGNNILTLIKHY